MLPLAILESVRELDVPTGSGADGLLGDLSAKRLGANQTIAAQIERLWQMVRGGTAVSADELTALLRLVARRNDAGLVFSVAGRRAGRLAVRDAGVKGIVMRGLPQRVRTRVGLSMVRRQARSVFGADLRRANGVITASISQPASASATDTDRPCSFFASGLAELLRAFTDFDSALVHAFCRSRGDHVCTWRSEGAVQPTGDDE